MKSDKLRVLFQLVSIIQFGQRCTPDQLAERLKIHRRTLFRYIKELQRAGIFLYYSRKQGHYTVTNEYFQQVLNLTDQEALCFLMLVGNLKVKAETPLSNLAVGAMSKIENILPAETRLNCHEIIERISTCSAHRAIAEKSYDMFVCPIKLDAKVEDTK